MSWTTIAGPLVVAVVLFVLAVVTGRWLRAIGERDRVIARLRSYTDEYAARIPPASIPCVHCGGPTGRAEYSLDSNLRSCRRCGRVSRGAA